MIKLDTKELKSISTEGNNINLSVKINKEIAIVTICLTSRHEKCNGRYIDSEGNFIIKCLCSCHLDTNDYSNIRINQLNSKVTRDIF